MNVSTIAPVLQAQWNGLEATFTKVSTDSRTLQPGDLFIALVGPHFNGHDFIADAIHKKAVAIIVSQPIPACPLPLLQVQDTRLAFGQLAAFHRQQFHIPVIGLTGSCGKTTTKAMLASILEQCGPTLATQGTLNNDFGVPKTLLELQPSHQYAVIEMGANQPGEIAYVTTLAKPTVAFITNAAPAHLEGFGDLPGVARAKAEIFSGLPPDGIALVNQDDIFNSYWRDIIGARRLLSFGRRNSADVTAREVSFDPAGYPQFILQTPAGEVPIRLQIMGEHNIMNALAASAAALAVGAPLTAIQQGLNSFLPVNKRMVPKVGLAGATILDDSYNANPLSVSAAIQTLAQKPGKKILALGEMRELGPEAPAYHAQIGREAKQQGIDCLFAWGDLCQYAVAAFGQQGFYFPEQAALITALQAELAPTVTVLVKGSLSTNMAKVVTALTKT